MTTYASGEDGGCDREMSGDITEIYGTPSSSEIGWQFTVGGLTISEVGGGNNE